MKWRRDAMPSVLPTMQAPRQASNARGDTPYVARPDTYSRRPSPFLPRPAPCLVQPST